MMYKFAPMFEIFSRITLRPVRIMQRLRSRNQYCPKVSSHASVPFQITVHISKYHLPAYVNFQFFVIVELHVWQLSHKIIPLHEAM